MFIGKLFIILNNNMINIYAILVSLDVSKLDIVNEVISLQLLNIYSILSALVLKVEGLCNVIL